VRKVRQIWAVSFGPPRTITLRLEGGLGLAIGDGFPSILNAARTGVPWAFERLYADLAPVVAGYLRLQGAAEPEDLTSDVFLGVFTGIDSFEGSETQFRSWVFTIAHRRLVDERRRLARRLWSPAGDLAEFDKSGGDVEADALDVLGSRRVVEWCAGLSADQRDVLVLRVVGDLTIDQVAAIVDKSPGAVKALQRRALTSLRQQVEKEGVTL
jgi:RNA polymerase sigma-70 factor (ECF subfamily)